LDEDHLKQGRGIPGAVEGPPAARLSSAPGVAYRCRNDSQWTVESVGKDVSEIITESKGAQEALTDANQRLAAHMDNSPLAVVEFDPGFRIVRWSDAAERMFGWCSAEVLGRAVEELRWVHEDDTEGTGRIMSDMQTGRRPRNVHVNRNYRKDGSVLYCQWHNSAIYDAQGRLTFILSQALDVTERHRAEEALRERTARYELVAAGTCDAIWDWDLVNRRVYFSPRWKELRGLSQDEVTDAEEEWSSGIHPEDAPRVMTAVQAHFDGRSAYFSEEYRIRCKDGTWKWILDRGIALRDAAGRVVRMAGSESDITDRKEAEQALHESEQRLAGIVGSAMDAIVSVDEQQRIRLFNAAAERMFGLSAEEAMGQPVARLIPERFRLAHGRHMRDFGATATTVRRMGTLGTLGTLRGLRASGEEFPAEASISQVEIGGAKVFTVILRDITDRINAEAGLRQSRERLELALQAARAGYWDWDLTSGRAACGTECYALWGVQPGVEDLDAWMQAVHPEDRERVNRAWREAGACGGDLRLEFRVDHPQGGVRWLMMMGRTLRDEAGCPMRMSGLSMDITDRKLAEEALRESQADLTRAQAVGRIGSWRLNVRRNELTWSPENHRIFGIPQGTPLTYETFLATVHPDDRAYVDRMWKAGLRGEPYDIEHRLVVDGQVKWVRERANLEFGQAGALLGGFGTTQEITELKAAEEALREANRRKDEFLATLAHELRNPLAPMRNAVEILRLRGSPDPGAASALAIIERQVKQMTRLVDDLLDVSRITRGKVQLRRECIALAAVVDGAAETSRHHMQCAGHQLSVVLPPEPIYLDADPVRLEQVLVNLLHNACKYTAKGGHIRVTAERAGTDVVVKVADTGIGIPSEQLSRCFDMFTQVTAAQEHAQGGLGIGLSLARSLVEMHGGSIEARSEGPGKGTEFIVRLPALDGAPAFQMPKAEDGAGIKAATARRVLVVDDNRDVAESLALLLRATGHDVEVAHDGLEAVEAAARYAPDVVLLDIGMPRQDGYAACRRIREHRWGQDMRIVALTGWGQDDDRRKIEEAGFDGHLVKPVEPSVLLGWLAERGKVEVD